MADIMTPEQMQELLLQQSEQLKKLADKNLELENKLATQNANTIKEEKPVKLEIPAEPVTVNGKKYKFAVAKFTIGENSYTATDVVTDEKLLKNLLAIEGQGILKEQV